MRHRLTLQRVIDWAPSRPFASFYFEVNLEATHVLHATADAPLPSRKQPREQDGIFTRNEPPELVAVVLDPQLNAGGCGRVHGQVLHLLQHPFFANGKPGVRTARTVPRWWPVHFRVSAQSRQSYALPLHNPTRLPAVWRPYRSCIIPLAKSPRHRGDRISSARPLSGPRKEMPPDRLRRERNLRRWASPASNRTARPGRPHNESRSTPSSNNRSTPSLKYRPHAGTFSSIAPTMSDLASLRRLK